MISSNKKLIFGVLNITTDSFSDGGLFLDKEKALERAIQMSKEGADFIDVGGESSRPFSNPVSLEEEIRRIIPVIEKIKQDQPQIRISVDTYKWQVAEAALKAGAEIINDIKGFSDMKMAEVAAKYNAGAIVMHMKGVPSNMQENPKYEFLEKEIIDFFSSAIARLESLGVKNIILDPGIGFGKTPQHNVKIIRNLSFFKKAGKPIMLGVSRKSFIGFFANEKDPMRRLPGTLAANVIGMIFGADIFRVHDIWECRQALTIAEEIMKAQELV